VEREGVACGRCKCRLTRSVNRLPAAVTSAVLALESSPLSEIKMLEMLGVEEDVSVKYKGARSTKTSCEEGGGGYLPWQWILCVGEPRKLVHPQIAQQASFYKQ